MHSSRPDRLAATSAPDVADLAEALAHADLAELGVRLKQARRRSGKTQSEIVEGLISPAYLSRIESGTRRPDLKILRPLAERLGTTPHELLLGLAPREWSARRVELDWAQLALRTGDAEGALAKATRLVDELPEQSRLYRRALYTLAIALEASGEYEQAAGRLEDLIEGETEGIPALEALTALSRCYRQAGELGRAIEIGERADRRVTELGMEGTPESVKLTLTVAAAHGENGDVVYAARLCQKALTHAEALRTPGERAGCYWNASIIESRRGNHDEAVRLGRQAIQVLDEAESTKNAARLRCQLGILYLRTNPPQVEQALEALAHAEQDLVLSEASPADLASNRLAQARAHFLSGDLRRARAGATDCLEGPGAGPIVTAEALVLLGQISFHRGDHDAARTLYGQAILALTGVGQDRSVAQLWFELAGLWMSVGCNEEALDAFQRAGISTGLQMNPVLMKVKGAAAVGPA